MDISIEHGPGSAAACVQLGTDETITAEGGSMISMSGNMDIKTTTHKKGGGNLSKAVLRMLSGEDFFLNHYTSKEQNGQVWLATAIPGDMRVYDLNQESLVVQGSSFVACSQDVEIDFGWQGFKSFLSGERAFWINLNGTGKTVINAFGCIYPVEVDGEYIVDTGHIVAFNESLDFSISKAGKSWLSSFLGGEGLVCRFQGQGTVWCQSHDPDRFGRSFGPKLKSRK
jgi:uncharacterized protein (TIGR00266 family)